MHSAVRAAARIAAFVSAAALGACMTGAPQSAFHYDMSSYPGHAPTSPEITAADLSARIEALADDRFEGRGPGTKNGEAAAQWIADEFKRIGVYPGNNGSYFQEVPAVTVALDPARSHFSIKGPDSKTETYSFPDQVAYWSPRFDKTAQSVENSELVFVGYGVVAPEYDWNDYEGVDVKGKTVVLLINDPGFITHDPKLFKGRAMMYYGRWTYKFEEARRQGAAAVIIVHEDEPAAYGWQVVRNSNSGPKSWLEVPDGNVDSHVTIESWITRETAEKLFARAGLDYEKLRIEANRRGFKAVPMGGLTLSAATNSSVKHMKTRNVIGFVPGSERPDEYMLYTAHWDHIGVKPDVPGDDKIHNGAVDNASGVSGVLEIAEAFAAGKQPKRSVAFLFVTLEEQGLLGSEYFAAHPVMPLNRIVAASNTDGMLAEGLSRDMVVVGSGASQLEDILASVLRRHRRVITPDPEPEKGSFYRSDHISLAKVGVPSLYAGGGYNLRVGGRKAGQAVRDAYRAERYHQPTDEWEPDWDLTGPVDDLHVLHEFGARIANGRDWPNWYKGNEFRAIRDRSLKGGG